MFQGGSSRKQGLKLAMRDADDEPPRDAPVRPCEWPSDDFLRAAGIYEDFYELAKNAGLTTFLHDQHDQYLLLTNTFVQNFHFHSRSSPPTVEFHLYDQK